MISEWFRGLVFLPDEFSLISLLEDFLFPFYIHHFQAVVITTRLFTFEF